MNELLDRWLEVIDIERKTRTGYVGKIEKHVRPTIGRLQVGRVRANTIEGLYAQLRRCRDHCRGEKFVQHRTDGDHTCDEHTARRKCAKELAGDPNVLCRWCKRACAPHRCVPLSAGSIRVVHAKSGAGVVGDQADDAARTDQARPDARSPGGRSRGLPRRSSLGVEERQRSRGEQR